MSAVVRIIETVAGRYGYHEKTGEVNQYDVSDIPRWRFWLAWAVQVEVTGLIEWGPYKTRAGARKEHRGQTKVELTLTEFYDDTVVYEDARNSRDEAGRRAKEIHEYLHEKGFMMWRPEVWGRRYESPHDEMLKNPLRRRQVKIIAAAPPARFRKRVEEKVNLETIMPYGW